ncbi:MAG: Asp-tRNA(Asn)/Glu-tRNA(Gln) amidotransferase subunit GatB [Candidatus Omnitrophica bacterium]|nr:Asp-tRNA(Asn)/Glu-tRNA(Gln) amidotransferase subunit GatB [Candidatus Omnitrophota bacterium]
MTTVYEAVIGLEVHVQLDTHSKIFCACSTKFGSEPNANTCPVCLGLPGSLPVLNGQALHLAVKVGIALNCEISKRLKFDRKNYFYPDLPKAYQISQFDQPVNGAGWLLIETRSEDGSWKEKKIGIHRAHLEEDAGKLLHEGIEGASLVDFNRAGVPLLEIVSDPDLSSPEEAYAYLTSLKAILQYLEVSDCNMEEGSLRCDANVSIRKRGDKNLGTKTEIKNLNSFKNVQRAIQYEIERQTELVEGGGRVIQETRLWNDVKAQTFVMRSKEQAHDYRYFPEPDLVPLTIESAAIEAIRKELPELPAAKAARFRKDYGLGDYDASVLVQEKALAAYFEQAIKAHANAKMISNWMQSELLALLNSKKLAIQSSPVSAQALAGLVALIESGTISGKIAKDVLPVMFETGQTAQEVVREKGWVQVTDESLIETIADKIIADNSQSVQDYRAGKKQALGFLVGQMMKASQGKVNPKLANEVLARKIGV